MDNSTSPFIAMQRAEGQIKALIRGLDTDSLDQGEKKTLAAIRRLASEARLDIRDYELSETREEQLGKAKDGRKRLAKLQTSILGVSMVFGPADIAQLGAQLEQINSWLK